MSGFVILNFEFRYVETSHVSVVQPFGIRTAWLVRVGFGLDSLVLLTIGLLVVRVVVYRKRVNLGWKMGPRCCNAK